MIIPLFYGQNKTFSAPQLTDNSKNCVSVALY